MNNIELLYIDLFCGEGGSSQGDGSSSGDGGGGSNGGGDGGMGRRLRPPPA